MAARTGEPTEADLRARVLGLVQPVTDAADVELVKLEVRGKRGSRIVRLVADAEQGLDIDTIASLSRDVGDVLDETDVIPGGYTLEVTSPGVDRPLRTPRDLARNEGRDVRLIRNRAAIDRGEKGEITGRLVGVTDEVLTLDVGDDRLDIPMQDLDYAKVVLPW